MTKARYDTFLQVRLSMHDKERIKARAVVAGLKISEYVRKRALGERIVPPRAVNVGGKPPNFRSQRKE